MPRKRTTATTPPKERAKLDSAEQVNREIKRLYRRRSNKEISDGELKSRLGALVALRAGLPDPVEHSDSATGFRVGIGQLNLVGIPHDWSCIGLFNDEIHIPSKSLPRLRALLPPDCFTPLPDLSLPPPIDETRPPPLLENDDEPPLAPAEEISLRDDDEDRDDPPAPEVEKPFARHHDGDINMNDMLRAIPEPKFPKPRD